NKKIRMTNQERTIIITAYVQVSMIASLLLLYAVLQIQDYITYSSQGFLRDILNVIYAYDIIILPFILTLFALLSTYIIKHFYKELGFAKVFTLTIVAFITLALHIFLSAFGGWYLGCNPKSESCYSTLVVATLIHIIIFTVLTYYLTSKGMLEAKK
ncbi:MAG: hypothetical protein ACMXYE_04985, partial [Candidatus Woesearchaeota archaeon]